MTITGKNYIDQSSLTCLNPGPNQLIDNLKIPQLSKTFQAANTTTVINIDLTSVIEIQSIVLDIGNMQNANIYVTGSTASIGDPEYTASLIETESCFYLFTNVAARYWKIYIDNGTKNPKFGYIHIGDYLRFPAINTNAVLFYSTTTQKTNSISGQQFTDRGYQFVSTAFEFPKIPETSELFLGTTVAGRQQIIEVWKETEFQYEWLFPWEKSLDKIPPIFGSMKSETLEFTRTEEKSAYWSLSFEFNEIK